MDEPKQKQTNGMPWWLVLIIVVLVSGLATGGTWYFMNTKVNSKQADIDRLNTDVSTLKKEKDALAKVTPTPTPTPVADETASWKTYTNSDYNVSFKYPAYFPYTKEDKATWDNKPSINASFFSNKEKTVVKGSSSLTVGLNPMPFGMEDPGINLISYALTEKNSKISFIKTGSLDVAKERTAITGNLTDSNGIKHFHVLWFDSKDTSHDYIADYELLLGTYTVQ